MIVEDEEDLAVAVVGIEAVVEVFREAVVEVSFTFFRMLQSLLPTLF